MKLCYFLHAQASLNLRSHTEMIETAKYSVFTAGIRYKAAYVVPPIRE